MPYRHVSHRVATQNAWLARGLVPEVKAVQVANYIKTLAATWSRWPRPAGWSIPA